MNDAAAAKSTTSGDEVRWFEGTGRAAIVAPDGARFVGVELWVPRGPGREPRLLHVTAKDRQGRKTYVDAEHPVPAGTWATVELPLADIPEAGCAVEVAITVRPPASRDYGMLPSSRRLRARRVWLRATRADASQVTIVVLNWKRASETIRCLESLAKADLGGASVLVVDNGSNDDSVRSIGERFPAQRVIQLPENRGYAGGNNAGIRAALSDGASAVLLLNNDTEVAPDFLQPLLWGLDASSKAGAVSSAVLCMDRPDTLEVSHLEVYFGHGIVYRRGVNALPGEGFDEFREVEVAAGCSLLISADALREVGLLDEDYFAYHEEVDWCWRARRKGYQIFTHPLSRVFHGVSKSTDDLARPVRGPRVGSEEKPQLPNPMQLPWNPVRTYLGARNSLRFVRTHGGLKDKIYFFLSSLHAVPLELLAVVMRQEEMLKLGLWSYREALAAYCLEDDVTPAPPSVARWLRVAARLPSALGRRLPKDIAAAHAEGRTAQLVEQVRGLWDGVRNRPIPLERLGLRQSHVAAGGSDATD